MVYGWYNYNKYIVLRDTHQSQMQAGSALAAYFIINRIVSGMLDLNNNNLRYFIMKPLPTV